MVGLRPPFGHRVRSLLPDDPHWVRWESAAWLAGRIIKFRSDKSIAGIFKKITTLEVLCLSGWRSPTFTAWSDDRLLNAEYPDDFDLPTHWRYRYPTYGSMQPPHEHWYPQYGIVP